MATYQEHLAYLMKNGIARTNRFRVTIPVPTASNVEPTSGNSFTIFGQDVVKLLNIFTGGSTTDNVRGLDMMIEQTELPGKQLQTTDIKYNGDTFKLPYAVIYGVQPFTFHVSRDMLEKTLLDDWMAQVYNPVTHEVSYMEDYATNIIISQLDTHDKVVYTVRLIDAFPISINPLVVSNEENNQTHKLMCQFAYRRWQVVGEETSNGLVDALSETPLGPFVTPILSNPVVQRGLDYLKDQGIDLEGEAVNIYNQIDEIVRNTTGQSINKSVSLLEAIRANTALNDRIPPEQQAQVLDVITGTIDRLKGG